MAIREVKKMEFKDVIRKGLNDKKMSQKDLADLTGYSTSTINSYIKGIIPSKERVDIICNALGVDPFDLPMDRPDLNMSVREAAIKMGKSPEFVERAIERHELPGCSDGVGHYHIPRIAFEKYMTEWRPAIDVNELSELVSDNLLKHLTT